MKKIEDLKPGQQVMVFDSHYGIEHDSTVITIVEPCGKTYTCALDRNNQIYLLERDKYDVNCLINSRGFGQVKGGKIEGWAFDRDGLKAFGEDGKELESTGWYKEA